jgi:prepilin-type processing-associated H-X9-DG protein
MPQSSRFTFVHLMVSLAIVMFVGAFLVSIVAPTGGRSRETANRVKCASNLRQIGQAMLLYANENHGHYPRAMYAPSADTIPTWGTGVTAADPFKPDGPRANDVTAAAFLLMRTQDITSEVFVCPTSNAERDDFGGGANTAANRSNFTDWKKNLSYSFHNPYPSDGVVPKDNPPWTTNSLADFALAADLNPGTSGGRDVVSVTMQSRATEMRKANSTNHEQDGQNVLYGDGHVEFQNNPFCGTQRDNIYTSGNGKVAASPVNGTDSVLLPAQDW